MNKLNRQQRRRIHKLTGEELEEIKDKATLKGISYTVDAFERVMRNHFGYGDIRMGRIAEKLYEELGFDDDEVDKL